MSRNSYGIATLLLLAGCGSSDEAGPDNSAQPAMGTEISDSAQAMAAPATEKPQINCSTVKGQAAPKGQPADDILGVRQGMTLDQVRNVLQCKNASFAINTSESTVSLPSGGQMSRINLSADSGLEKVNVWLVGPTGKEQVMHVDRTSEFTPDKELPVTSIEQELAGKYGGFDSPSNGGQGMIVRSRDGQKLSQSNSSYYECGQHNFNAYKATPCLSVISYQVQKDNENPELASRFTIAITNQAKGWSMVEAGEQKLTQDVQKAKENAQNGQLSL